MAFPHLGIVITDGSGNITASRPKEISQETLKEIASRLGVTKVPGEIRTIFVYWSEK